MEPLATSRRGFFALLAAVGAPLVGARMPKITLGAVSAPDDDRSTRDRVTIFTYDDFGRVVSAIYDDRP